jgi:Protein kinase domain/zinc-ribbon domain
LNHCPKCGSSLPAAAQFCSACGKPVSSVSQLPTGLASPSVDAAARRRSPTSAPVGRLASSDVIVAGGFTPGAILAERYRVIGLLGRGGMGEVYRADDLKLGQPVALKFLPRHLASEKDRLERFYAEVRIARQVSHPNVCRVYDVGELDGQHYLSMEYVDGEDLASLLKRIGRLPPDKALEIARELCAGLAAAHERGVLHRDLKPSNVMLDGRGRARITDFGLAIAASEVVEGEVSGTPAYMAPEQLAGKPASVRSDVYSLGLVLYELSTGRKAFDSATFQDLKRKHAEDPPAPPSTIAPGFDPAVERVILRCLEKEPSARPASAAQIAAALPGGDPLAAALAAGETPSPEMVAAAGEEGALAPAKAWAMLGVAVAVLGAVVGLARFAMEQGLAPFPKSPEFLAERSRELIRSFGYTSEPADEASWWDRRYDYLTYLAAHEPSTRWWRSLARTEPHPWWFWHRQSPRFLVPENSFGEPPIRPTDPPLEVSGMVNLALDARGNLMRLRAVPPQVEAPGTPATPPVVPDWKPLFAAAGLDFERFSPSPPRWLPSEPFDTRADWDGAYASSPNVPIHVSAAAWRGRPVSFEVLGPWDLPERMQEQAQAAGLVISNYGALVFILSAWAAALFMARRNLRLGRGDRRGAIRIATFVFSGVVLSWIFSAHHVPSRDEGWMFLNFLAMAVFLGAFVWLAYIAIEPIVRRRWPELLFSWSRLLSGRFRDPLVGRDLLAGIFIGALMLLLLEAAYATPNWVDLAGMIAMPPSRATMLSAVGAASVLFSASYSTPLNGLGFLTILVLSQVVLRRRWLAVGLTGILLVVMGISGENSAVEIPASFAVTALLIFAAVRFGILAFTVALFVYGLLASAPLTLDLSRWYAARGFLFVALILALAAWAFRVSLGSRPVFGGARLDDA